ncbi:alpha/beta fold hydrolase [Ichthyenterobacterium magnum]|uniref:Pimeloyl-ACP methyl ester carboxylesterase n=1 Tax=Ichthyenterobacterium magnum TaxID=1230530 RepID=A0A420DWT1_9FLAO|nr:alpha/beta hydrolase [Ichthyenterobacterium magnum]RKE98694.1 pimeloyl-ACP methyl ester carboxylesterase [Ichthyenterobacterium magnum]
MILVHKGIDVFYTDEGFGEVIVLIHGFLENSSMWNDLIPHISKTHRAISIDLLGHGKSGCLGYIHSMELMAEAVEAVLNHLNIESSTFIGHSLGGYVSLAYAEKYTDKVKGLCLMNSTAQEDSPERKLNRDRAINAVKQNYRTFVSMAVANLFALDNREKLSKEINYVKEEALKTPLQGIIATLEGMKIRKDRTTFFKDASFKKLQIIGKKDSVLNYESLIYETKNTDIEVVEFSGGHMSHVENKEEFTYKIIRFIEK